MRTAGGPIYCLVEPLWSILTFENSDQIWISVGIFLLDKTDTMICTVCYTISVSESLK